MNKEIKNMVLNTDGYTYRYPGNMQWQMNKEQQKAAGLIAETNRSIHGREVKAKK